MEKIATEFEKALEERRVLHAAARELRESLGDPRPGVASAEAHEWASALAGRLEGFHDRVVRQFRGEESSGFLDRICRSIPRVTKEACHLRDQHDELLGELRDLLGAARMYAEGHEPEQPNLRQRAVAFLDSLDRHEHEEIELAQRLLCEDLGVGD